MSAVAAKRAARADYAVAGHDDGNRIALHCASDRLRGHAAAAASFGQFGGEFAVTYRHAIGNLGHQIPHFMLEWRAGGMQRRRLI